MVLATSVSCGLVLRSVVRPLAPWLLVVPTSVCLLASWLPFLADVAVLWLFARAFVRPGVLLWLRRCLCCLLLGCSGSLMLSSPLPFVSLPLLRVWFRLHLRAVALWRFQHWTWSEMVSVCHMGLLTHSQVVQVGTIILAGSGTGRFGSGPVHASGCKDLQCG